MEKKYAVILALLITGLIASNFYLLSYSAPEREEVIILEIIDGDTIKLEDGRTVRLLNINSPEKNQPLSNLSKRFLEKYKNKSVEIEITGSGIYGRDLARVYSSDYLNLKIVELGFAHKYLVDSSEIKDFQDAEKSARKKELGIWKKSKFYGCLEVQINKNQEYIIINNICDSSIELAMKDESTRTFTFTINANAETKVFSQEGPGISLGSSRNIWNNDKDSIFLRDKDGFLVYYGSYGH